MQKNFFFYIIISIQVIKTIKEYNFLLTKKILKMHKNKFIFTVKKIKIYGNNDKKKIIKKISFDISVH